tara:strand:- start:14 stop:241 length:228 start_codon:yes stop_codon:yes gene_type:complete
MVNIEELSDPIKGKQLIEYLTLISMKANYPSFVREYGYELANKHMGEMFKRSWDSHKEEVWQWYDLEIKQIIDNA